MRLAIAMIGMVALAGCGSAGEKAKARADMVERNGGSPREICEARKAVTEAYLNDGNESAYKGAKLSSDIACFDAATHN